jgi:hypothetical protein
LSLAVVGIDYPNKRGPARRFELALCRPGEPVELIREPKNPADPRAVAVFSCRGVQLGYLTAERCGWIGRMIGEGREIEAVFQGVEGKAAWVRAAFDGARPEVRENECEVAAASVDEDFEPDQHDGFWPDPIYPDD